MDKFNGVYFFLALLLFLIEVLIAKYLHTGFVRAYAGDFLVVIFLYCLAKSFLNASNFLTAVAVLLIAYLVEISQYFHLINRLGLQNSLTARLILGTTFSIIDMLTYTLGILLVLVVEYFIKHRWKNIL